MKLKLRSKIPPYVVFFVLYEFCVLFSCCMKLSFSKFLFSAFLKLKAKRISLDATTFLIWVDIVINWEERDPYWPVL